MPIYMDRHNTGGVTRQVIAVSHEKDLAIQGKYGVRFITYWFDEVLCKAFCLVDAPNKDALQKVHEEAHGILPTRSSKSIPRWSRRSWEGSRIRLPFIAAARSSLIRPRVRSCLPICRTRLA